MARTIKIPVLGQSVEEVRIVQWFKKIGDTVAVGEALGEIETDKTNMEFVSTDDGTVLEILAPVDSYVRVEMPVVVVGEAGEVVGAAPEPIVVPVASVTVPALPETTNLDVSPRARRLADTLGVTVRDLAGKGTGPNGRIIERDIEAAHAELERAAAVALAASSAPITLKVSPLAQAIATIDGVDLASVAGSGSGGRITASDVKALSEPAPTPAPTIVPTAASGKRTVALAGLRKRVADNLSRSVREKPHVTLHLSVDMSEATRLRKQLLPQIEKAEGIRISPTDIIVKAAGVALREHTTVNAHIEGDTLTLFDAVNIGLAVSLGDDGLIVPVIQNVETKGLSAIARDRVDLADRARKGKLGSNEISGGTFTITNLGNYGVQAFNPIIPPPQVAILGVCAITDTIVAVNGAPAVRPMMGLSLSFDHRAIDGAPAAAFLARLKEILESPYLLLL